MMEFDIPRSGRRCHATQQELKPGDIYYSDLTVEKDNMQRIDYCEQAWQGPSESSIGWWKSQIPKRDTDKVYWAPRDILVAYFEQLIQTNQHPHTTYLMALLLVRRRVGQLVEFKTDDSGCEVMHLRLAKENKLYEVVAKSPAVEEVAQIQRELAEHLFVDQPVDDE